MLTKKDSFKKLQKQMDFVLKNPYSDFYREKYKKDGWDGILKKPSDFLKVPFLTRGEIVQTPAFERLFVKENLVKAWSVSSGTTEYGPLVIPKMVHKGDTEYDQLAQIIERLRVQKVLTLASPTYFGNTRVRIWCYHKKLSKHPFISGLTNNLTFSAKLAHSLGIDGLETTSSILNYFIPFLKESYDFSKIKLIILFGEFTSQAKYKFFKSYFKNAFFHFRFGGSEYPINPGFRCKYLASQSPRFFHPHTQFYLFEVVDSELIITTLEKCAFPLIRYKTGDSIIFHKNECQCGQKGLIEHLGRVGYDFLKVSGGMVHTEMIDKALDIAKIGSGGVYKLHVYEIIHDRRLKTKLVLELSKRVKKGIETAVENNLYLSRTQTLSDLVKQDLFLPLEIKLGKGFDQKPKIIRIVSHLK